MTARPTPILLTLLMVVALASITFAADASSLRPPKGANVALVVFEDLQCPDCARAAPLVQEAVRTYKIPLVRHDFPLPKHNWAFDAAVLARYFDTQSKKLGDEFREYVFTQQPGITPENLRGHGEKFAAANGMALPFLIDRDGQLAAKVKADLALGQRVGIEHTPTIYVVSNRTTGPPFIEVVDRSQLFSLIDNMKREAEAQAASRPAHAARKVASKKASSQQPQ